MVKCSVWNWSIVEGIQILVFFAVKVHSDCIVSLHVVTENYWKNFCVIQSVKDKCLHILQGIFILHIFFPIYGVYFWVGDFEIGSIFKLQTPAAFRCGCRQRTSVWSMCSPSWDGWALCTAGPRSWWGDCFSCSGENPTLPLGSLLSNFVYMRRPGWPPI